MIKIKKVTRELLSERIVGIGENEVKRLKYSILKDYLKNKGGARGGKDQR